MAVENFGNTINMGRGNFMPQPKEGINQNLVERVRSTMQSRSENGDGQARSARFARAGQVGRFARVAALEAEAGYIKSLLPEASDAVDTPKD